MSETVALRWALSDDEALVYDVTIERGDEAALSTWTLQIGAVGEENTRVVATNDLSSTALDLRVRPDGRVDGGAVPFGSDVVLRTVWTTLPRRPVSVGDRWDDAQLVRPFLDLLPVGTVDVVTSESSLVSLIRRDERTTAIIDSEAVVRLHGRVVIEVIGRAQFDVDRGRLTSRDVDARFHDPSGSDTLHVAATESGGLRRRPGGRE